MLQDPYHQAHRVFWIVDNAAAHRGLRSIRRLRDRYPNLLLVPGLVHASWLKPIEVYFSAKYPGRARTWAPGKSTVIRTRRQLPSNSWLAG